MLRLDPSFSDKTILSSAPTAPNVDCFCIHGVEIKVCSFGGFIDYHAGVDCVRTVNGIIYLDMKTRGVYLELTLRVDEEHSTSLMIHPDPSKPDVAPSIDGPLVRLIILENRVDRPLTCASFSNSPATYPINLLAGRSINIFTHPSSSIWIVSVKERIFCLGA